MAKRKTAKRKTAKRRPIKRAVKRTVKRVRKKARKARKTVARVRKTIKRVRRVRKISKAVRAARRLAKLRRTIKTLRANKAALLAKARKVRRAASLARARKARRVKTRNTNGNPQLLVITNPCPKATYPPTEREVSRVNRAYKRFHFTKPATRMTADVPKGYPSAYMVIGELERFDVKTPAGRVVSRRYGSGSPRPVLCTTAAMKDLYVFDTRRLGIPAGVATRCDYRVPAHSGRNKWARRWWHSHDTKPYVHPHGGGKAVRVSGRGLSVRPEGIVG